MTYRKALMLADGLVFAGVVLMVALLLSGCAHKTGPAPNTIPPKAPDPRICAAIEPEPTPSGGIVRPLTPEEVQQTDRFLDAEIDVRRWGRRGWAVVAISQRQFCPK